MEKKNVEVVEEATEVLAEEAATGLTTNQKVGLAIAGVALTAGIAYGVYRLVRFIRAKRAAKKAQLPAPEGEETNNNPEPNA